MLHQLFYECMQAAAAAPALDLMQQAENLDSADEMDNVDVEVALAPL